MIVFQLLQPAISERLMYDSVLLHASDYLNASDFNKWLVLRSGNAIGKMKKNIERGAINSWR